MSRARGPGRVAFGVNASLSAVLVLVVAAVALVVQPPAPPGIAAFAPQAAKPITKAPPGQSSLSGDGGGQCAAGQVCTGPSAKPVAQVSAAASPAAAGPAKGVPSALQCYTWPDGTVTQTFDPQSPPCIADWPEEEGNGGATSQGVTGTTIRVAVPTSPQYKLTTDVKPLVDFFNSRFQLYGRKIQLVPYTSREAEEQAKGGGITSDPSLQKADAAAASALKPFAALDFVDPTPYIAAIGSYVHTLADRGVVSVVGGTISPAVGSAELAKHHPYEWTYQPTADAMLRTTASLTCSQLVGHPAAHAAQYVAVTRKFAILLPAQNMTGNPLPGLDAFERALARCGITEPEIVRYTNEDADASALAASFIRLRNDGVTSLLYYPQLGGAAKAAPQKVASNVGYRPEWVTMGYYHWATAGLQAGAPDQMPSTFGVGSWNKLLPLQQTPWVQAFGLGGGDVAMAGAIRAGEAVYRELLMLASGIQMAGPHLTPDTFGAALQSTTFANPGAARAPSYQGTVGFDGDHTMLNDFAAFWMDPTSNGAQVTSAGATQALNTYQAFCYVGLGLRWSENAWPRTDRFYQGPCR